MSIKCDQYFTLQPKQVTKEQIDDIFNKAGEDSKYGRFKRGLENNNGRFSAEKIAEVYNGVFQNMEDCGGHYKINVETENLKYDLNHVNNITIETDIIIDLFKDISKITLDGDFPNVIKGTIPKNALHLFESKYQEVPEKKQPPVIDYLLKTYDQSLDTNLNFKVNDKEIKAHKLILNQKPFFADKHQQSLGVAFKEYSFDEVNAYIRSLYGAELDLQNMDILSCIRMIELNNLLGNGEGDKNVKASLLKEISKKVNESNFSSLLLESYTDSELRRFTTWKIYELINTGSIDFSRLPTLNLLAKIYILMKDCKFEDTQNKGYLLNEIGKKLQVNSQDFIQLCDNADKPLRKAIINVFKNNRVLFEELKTGKNDKLKQHWLAYQEMMNNIDIM